MAFYLVYIERLDPRAAKKTREAKPRDYLSIYSRDLAGRVRDLRANYELSPLEGVAVVRDSGSTAERWHDAYLHLVAKGEGRNGDYGKVKLEARALSEMGCEVVLHAGRMKGAVCNRPCVDYRDNHPVCFHHYRAQRRLKWKE
jgi:hypothetical protein